jgi:LAO/AO transport system kinase
MTESIPEWAEKVLAADRRAITRAITAIENGDRAAIPLLRYLFPSFGKACVVGVTGSPGAGKSTLVEQLASEYRRQGSRVGVIAVDPSSPFSGGAILGDRIRMQSLATDEGVYIRSMATRGHLGGLAAATQDAAAILDASGYQVVLIETVGVGQDEIEVARLADVTVLLLVPGMGDEIQVFKAGIMEIADLFVVNKADRPGAEQLGQQVVALRNDGWVPPVLKTVATTGEGVTALRKGIEQFRTYGGQPNLRLRRRKEQWRARLLGLLRQRLFERAMAGQMDDGALDRHVADIMEHRRDPYSVVEELIEEFVQASQKRSGEPII